jgi:hypothetical protein
LQRLKGLPHEFADFFEHLKFAILIPLSWYLTMFKFFRVLVWRFFVSARVPLEKAHSALLRQTLPLRLFINFYEKRVVEAFPWLPSIWGTLFYLFPEGIKFPTFTSLTAGPYKGAGPIGEHSTLVVDINSIVNGGEPNGVIEGAGDRGGGDHSSQVNTNHSKLETALKNITTFPPGDLDAGLEKVKVRAPQGLLFPNAHRFSKGCTG